MLESQEVEARLQEYVDGFQVPTMGSEHHRRMKRRYSQKKCLQEMKVEAGIASMLAWWLLSWAIKAIIKRMANKLWNKIHSQGMVNRNG